MHFGTIVELLVNSTKLKDTGITFIESSSSRKFISYLSLYEKSTCVLAEMNALSLKKGVKVILQVQDNERFLTVFWACLLGGMIPVPLAVVGAAAHREKLLNVWNNLESAILIADEEVLKTLQNEATLTKDHLDFSSMLNQSVAVNTLFDNQLGKEAMICPSEVEDLVYIQYSSGSTGRPKGIRLTNKNLVTNIQDIIAKAKISSTDSMISWMPLTHDMGLIGIHLTGLVAGVPQFLMPTSLFVRRPLLWLNCASEYKATLLYSPNFGFQYCLDALQVETLYDWNLEAVRLIFNGAEPIQLSLCREFLTRLLKHGLNPDTMYPVYGLAEASLAVTMPDIAHKFSYKTLDRNHLAPGASIQEVAEESGTGIRFVEVGKPVPSCAVRICDQKDQPSPDAQIGHVQIKGENVTKGYFNNSISTEQLFTKDRWLRTGDLGFICKGSLTIVGRTKDVIIVNGQNYYCHDIEATLAHAKLISPGAVVASAVPEYHDGSEKFTLFILFKKSTEEFVTLSDKVAAVIYETYKIFPDVILPVKKIPKTSSGKLKRFELVKNWMKGDFEEIESRIVQIRTKLSLKENELRFEEIVKKVIPIFPEDMKKNWTALGLNSLGAIKLVSLLNKTFHADLTLKDVFHHSTPESLAYYLKERPVRNSSFGIAPVASPLRNSSVRPMTMAEERYLFNHHFDRSSNEYTIFQSFELIGEICPERLQQAFVHCFHENENLQSSFQLVNGKASKIVRERFNFKLHFKDLKDEELWGILLHQQGNHFINSGFDLSEEVFRAALFKLENSRFILLIVTHQIVVDGWSLKILLESLRRFYRLEQPDFAIKLKEVQFSDFTLHQKRLLDEGVFDAQEIFWRNEMSGNPQKLSFGPRIITSGQSPDGFSIFNIPVEEVQQLKKLSSKYEVTLFTALCTTLRVLFHKYTGKSDLFFGITSANRTVDLFEDTVGSFSNTLPIRTVVDSQMLFGALLRTMNHKILNALDNQSYPYELITGSDDSKEPNVLVVFQNFDFNFSDLGKKIEVKPFNGWSIERSIADLHLEFQHQNEGLSLTVRYKKSFLQEAQVKQLINHFTHLINLVTEEPELPIERYPLLSPDALHQLLEFSTGPFRTYAVPDETIIERIERTALLKADHIALIHRDLSLTYRELLESVSRFSNYFQGGLGLVPGDSIALIIGRSEINIALMLASLKIGVTYVPVEPSFPKERIIKLLSDSGVRIAICIDSDAEKFVQAECRILPVNAVNELLKTGRFFGEHIPILEKDKEGIAYIMYTSGSSGVPKGVSIPEVSLSNYVLNFSSYFRLSDNDRIVHQSSLSFDTSVEEIFPALVSGGACIISDASSSLQALQKLMVREKITLLTTVPAVIAELNEKKNLLPKSLRILISGGDVLYPGMVENIIGNSPEVYNTYGPSETTVCVAYKKLESASDAPYLGYPIGGHSIYIMNEDLCLVPRGFPGEICVSGPGVSAGYINLVDLTDKQFKTNPFNSSQRLYKTGDFGMWSPDGELQFIGRKDSQLKLNGIRIETGEIERVLQDSALVKEVYIDDGKINGTQHGLIAFYVPRNGCSEQKLIDYLSEYLPYQMIPARFISVPQLPRKISGKVDWHQLRKSTTDLSVQQYVHATTPLEEQLIKTWSKVLSRNIIGITDNFFEIGGDSIKAIYVCSHLRDNGIRIDVKDLFIHRTIHSLAQTISRNAAAYSTVLSDSKSFSFLSDIIFDLAPATKTLIQLFTLKSFTRIDEGKLRFAFFRVIQKHQALRLQFHKQDENLVWTTLPPDEAEIKIVQYATADEMDAKMASERVNLSARIHEVGSISMAVTILRVNNYPHDFLLIGSHPFFVDSHSWNIVLNDLVSEYRTDTESERDRNYPISQPQVLYEITKYKDSPEFASSVNFWQKAEKAKFPELQEAQSFDRISMQYSREVAFFLRGKSREDHNIDPAVLLLFSVYNSLQEMLPELSSTLAIWEERRIQTDISLAGQCGTFVARFPLRIFFDDIPYALQLTRLKEIYGQHVKHSLAYGLLEDTDHQKALNLCDVRFEMLDEVKLNGDNSNILEIREFQGTPLIESTCRHKLILRTYSLGEEQHMEAFYDSLQLREKDVQTLLRSLSKMTEHVIQQLSEANMFTITPSDFSLNLDDDEISSLF